MTTPPPNPQPPTRADKKEKETEKSNKFEVNNVASREAKRCHDVVIYPNKSQSEDALMALPIMARRALGGRPHIQR